MSEATEFIKEYAEARGGIGGMSGAEKEALVLQYIMEDRFSPQKIAAAKKAVVRELGVTDPKKIKALTQFIDKLNAGTGSSPGRRVIDGRRGFQGARA